jgi:diadenosine tetraphosphate (Ap4A) HIT family hydrolase
MSPIPAILPAVTDCPFCTPAVQRRTFLADAWCYAIWTQDTGIPQGSAMILPREHRGTVWDLTDQEWASTRTLLHQARELITELHHPDGWNTGPVAGQSVPHAHCHLVPRYLGEPLAGRGIRSWIKDPTNQPTTD